MVLVTIAIAIAIVGNYLGHVLLTILRMPLLARVPRLRLTRLGSSLTASSIRLR